MANYSLDRDTFTSEMIFKRTGTRDADGYREIREELTVFNGKVCLQELPDRFRKVQVSEPAAYGNYLQAVYQANITLASDTNSIDIATHIVNFLPNDNLIVTENTTIQSVGINYSISGTIITNLEGNWESGTQLTFIVIKSTPDLVSGTKYWREIKSGFPNEYEYLVDYNEQTVTFHPSTEGKTLQFYYFGKGTRLFPASRVYLYNSENPNVLQTLQQIIESMISGMENPIDIGVLGNLLTTDKSNIVNAINDLVLRIDNAYIENLQNQIILDTETDTFDIGIFDYVEERDSIEIYVNGVKITKNIDYSMSGTICTITTGDLPINSKIDISVNKIRI